MVRKTPEIRPGIDSFCEAVWLSLKQPVPSQELFKRCFEEVVSYVPGNKYLIDKSDHEHNLRLNFTYQSEEFICRGIERFGRVLDNF